MATSTAGYAKPVDRLIQIIDYVRVDYQKAVLDGKVVSATEYTEMLEFATTMESLAGALVPPAGEISIDNKVGTLKDLIVAKAPADQIAAAVNIIRSSLIKSYNLSISPDRVPNISHGQQLYRQNCASCHGIKGYGDGPQADSLTPKPTNFHNSSRYRQRSLYGLFNTITYGVSGTAMSGFAELTKSDRWNLSAYVGQLGTRQAAVDRGKNIWQKFNGRHGAITRESFAALSPDDAAKKWPGGADVMAYLRRSPGSLFAASSSPIAYTLDKLRLSYRKYSQGEKQQAYDDAVRAYLEGFELIEVNLATIDQALMKQIEGAMGQYRGSLQHKAALADVTKRYQELLPLLKQAQNRLDQKDSLTPLAAFLTGFIILLREGLEALLVIAALSAFLIKTGRRDAMPYVHFGWISALLLGVATWFISDRLLQISGATREVTEGIAALTASAMLLFVGYWLHNKVSVAGWQRFIQESVKAALDGRTLWGLAGLSFITVYREVFETILFYQALWAQADGLSGHAVTAGFITSSVVLIVLSALAVKYSVRLPLRQFFGGTGILLLILSFVFAGEGIAALQEAGKISQTLLPFPSVGWLGIFPSLEGLSLQALILIIAFLVYIKDHNTRQRP